MLPYLSRAVRQPVGVAPLRPRGPQGDRRRPRGGGRASSAASPARSSSPAAAPRPTTRPSSARVARRGGTAVCPAAEHHAVLESRAPRARRGGGHHGHRRRRSRCAGRACSRQHADVSVVSVMAVNNEVGTINDLAAVAQVVRRHAPAAVLHTDAVQAPCWLDLRTDHAARRPPLAVGAQVRRAEGRGRAGRPRGRCVRADAHRRRPGTRTAQRHAQRGRHRGDGRGVAPHRRRATRPSCRASPRCATASSIGFVAELPGVHETVPRDHKVAGSAHLCIDGIENEALLFLLDEAGRVRQRGLGLRGGRDGAVARARRDGRAARAGAGCGAAHARAHHAPQADVDRGVEVLVRAVHQLRRDRDARRRHEGADGAQRRRRLVGRCGRTAARRPRGGRHHHAAVGRRQRHRVLLGGRRRRRPPRGAAAGHRPPGVQLHRRLRRARRRAVRAGAPRRDSRRTRASSATATSSSTGSANVPTCSASMRSPPATTRASCERDGVRLRGAR